MPKKKNFLGGQQNYNPNNGQYEPALKGPNGESPKGFSSFKKEKDESFDAINKKRMGEENESFDQNDEDALKMLKWGGNFTDDEWEKVKANENWVKGYLEGKYTPKEIKNALKAENENNSFDQINAKRMGKEQPKSEETQPGKITTYSPFLRQADGSWKKDDSRQERVKTLNNGLAMVTKAGGREHFYGGGKGKYKIVDLDTGTVVTFAESYDDAMKISNDTDFMEKVARAKKVFLEKHPEFKK